jgi:hypothetical protein
MYSTSCYKEHLNFENTLYIQGVPELADQIETLMVMKVKRLLGTFLTLQKKLELHVGFEQQIKFSGSSERKKTKLD